MAQQEENDRVPEKIIIYGDYFNQDTRAILAICDISEVNREFVVVDSFKGEQKQAPFKHLNPACSIPLITEGTQENPTLKVAGDRNLADLYNYLIDNHVKVSQKLYPAEQGEQIIEMMNWFKKNLRQSTSRLISQALEDTHNARDSLVANTSQQAELTLYHEILKHCETQLEQTKYLTGNKISIIDVMVYCEINTIVKLFKDPIPEALPETRKWVERVSLMTVINNQDIHLDVVLKKQKLGF